MSKLLVQKALGLLQDDINSERSEKGSKPPSKRCRKSGQNGISNHMKKTSGIGKNYGKVDRIAENIKILKKLRKLKPKPSVVEKVIEYYKQSSSNEPPEKPEVQRSILFDDDDEDNKKKRKKRKRKKAQDDDF